MRKHPLPRTSIDRLPGSRLALILGQVLLSVALAAPASAQDPASAASEHAKAAFRSYQTQEWKVAIEEYRAAYKLDPKPEYLWGLAQAQRSGGDCVAAIKSYQAFGRIGVSMRQRSTAEQMIKLCNEEIAKGAAEPKVVPPPPKVEPPSPAVPPPPPVTPPPAPPPAAGPVSAQPLSPAPQPDKPTPWYADPLGHVLVISGAALAATGSVFVVMGTSDAKSTSGTYDEVISRHDDGRRKQILGVGGIVVGGTLLVNGVVRYLLVESRRAEPQTTLPRVSAALGPQAATLFVTGQF